MTSTQNSQTNHTNVIGAYANDLRDNVQERNNMPWPLLRNHVYTITIDGKSGTRSNNDGLSIRSKESHSERLTP